MVDVGRRLVEVRFTMVHTLVLAVGMHGNRVVEHL